MMLARLGAALVKQRLTSGDAMPDALPWAPCTAAFRFGANPSRAEPWPRTLKACMRPASSLTT